MNDNRAQVENLHLNFEEDIKEIAEKYVDYLPETANKESFLKALVKTLANQ